MTRDEKIATAREMRAAGAKLREIGDRFGVSPQTVMRWTDDEANARMLAECRANKTRYRGECVDCGQPTVGDSPGDAPARCVPCNCAHSRKLTRRWILDSFAEWYRMFGEVPAASDWEPRIRRPGPARERALQRREATGRPWPGPTVVTNNFGSWNAGVAAAGFTPVPAGVYRDESKRRRGVTAARRARRDLIAAMWLAGLSGQEIAERVGLAPRTVYGEIGAMRDEGRSLPLRGPARRAAEVAA